MKTNRSRPFLTSVAAATGLLVINPAGAGVIPPINSPGSSYASILFDDTASFDPSLFPGITSLTQNVTPWGGAPPINNILALTTDPVTFDFAQGGITADVIAGNYSLAFNNVTVSQIPLNTGFAHLLFNFSVEFQLDGLGLPSQPTVFPTFAVNGTVQPGGFAAIKGSIDYYAVNTAGTYGIVETVNYGSWFTTPGTFTATVTGIPTFGSTPALVPNTTLTLSGYMDFIVDPATLNASTVPEPSGGIVVGLAALAGVLWRRRS